MTAPLGEWGVVWARMSGYPWWPAVLSAATVPPHLGMWKTGMGRRLKYHCTFLAWNKETAWLEGTRVRRFKCEDGGEGRRKEYFVKKGDLKKSHMDAIELGLEILNDLANPWNHLVKKSIAEDTNVKNGLLSKISHLEEEVEDKPVVECIHSKTIQTPVRQAKTTREAVLNSVDVEGTVEFYINAEITPTKSCFIQTIAEKVKNARIRQTVEKFHPLEAKSSEIIGKFVRKKQLLVRPPGTLHSQSPGGLMDLLSDTNLDNISEDFVKGVEVKCDLSQEEVPMCRKGFFVAEGSSHQLKRRRPSSFVEYPHPDSFCLEGEPVFKVVAEYDEETKLYIRDGQRMDLITLIGKLSNQESTVSSDSPATMLEKLKSSQFFQQHKQMVRSCSSGTEKEFAKTDPTLPDGFKVKEKLRGDGRRMDREFLNQEGTLIFRSKPAVFEYLRVVNEQIEDSEVAEAVSW